LDRSAIHADRFTALVQSPLASLCRRGALEVYHTPVFLEETLSTYGAVATQDDWREHLRFALEIGNGGFFQDKVSIWRSELLQGRGPHATRFLPEKPSRFSISRAQMAARLRQLATTGDLAEDWQSTQPMRRQTEQQKSQRRSISAIIRQKVADAVRSGRVRGKAKHYPFEKFLESERIPAGRLLMDLVDPARAGVLADQWSAAHARCPFYSAFVAGFHYNGYYAMLEQSEPLDRNAQADYEQLCYLQWADVIVSNDFNFFRFSLQRAVATPGQTARKCGKPPGCLDARRTPL